MSHKKLSIILVNYKSDQFIGKCIASIYKNISLGEEFEIIVVNNDNDNKLELVSSLYPKIKIIHSKNNGGFGSGVNLGVREAAGEILFFLNPDAQILSKNVRDILSIFSKDNNLGVLGGRLVAENGKTQKWSVGKEVNFLNLIKNNFNFNSFKKNRINATPMAADWISGAALFVKKELFNEIGGFDENYFMYFEDVDFCKRAKGMRKKVVYYPDFLIKHIGGKCYSQKDQQKKDYYRSQEYYFKKHRNYFEWQLVKMLQKLFF